jgi:hypothetical protein
MRHTKTYSTCATIFDGSQIPSSPFSIPAAMTPSGRQPSAWPQAMRLNLSKWDIPACNFHESVKAYLELFVTVPRGPWCPSPPRSYSCLLRKLGAHISNWLSLEKDSSSAPATVPVASKGAERGDHAKVDVLWISFSFMMVSELMKSWQSGR